MLLATLSAPDSGPSARVRSLAQARPARYRRASSAQPATLGSIIKPFLLFLAPRRLWITVRQQFVESIPRPMLGFDDQSPTSDCQAHFRSRAEVQAIEEGRRYSQHDRAADL